MNWEYGSKIPKQLNAVTSGNNFSENLSGLAINRESQSQCYLEEI